VTFSGQVHDCAWLVLSQNAVHFRSVADVDLLKGVPFTVAHFRQAFQVAGVSEFVEVDHFILGVLMMWRMTAEPMKPEPPVMSDFILDNKFLIYFSAIRLNKNTRDALYTQRNWQNASSKARRT
jgi:hypothetical protein